MQNQGIDGLIAQLRASAALAAGQPAGANARPEGTATGADFAALLKSALDQVNGLQTRATALAQDFELGRKGVELHDVMLAMQKANVAFQGTVQVRNRLVTAYQDIMNMQI